MANQTKFGETVFNVGDLVKLHLKIIEEGKERETVFNGLVIKIKGRGEEKTFTVRKIGAAQIGIERIFPLNSPWIKKIQVEKKGRVRRAKLYYLRNKSPKEIKGKLKLN
jgi:large subunit ribosomal protein L19